MLRNRSLGCYSFQLSKSLYIPSCMKWEVESMEPIGILVILILVVIMALCSEANLSKARKDATGKPVGSVR